MPSPPACDTLRVLHLPPHLSDEKRDELFKKYGATNTKTIRKSNTYTTTFVKFTTKEAATQAFLQLHQLEVKGQYLSIEFAKRSLEIPLGDNSCKFETINDNEKIDTANTEHFQAFLKKLNTWTSNYNFSQPPPPNISYQYPSPTKNTLLRIAIQLVREPAFYTQVLHLMNKMNLPPPFEELEDEFPTLKEVYDIEKYRDIFGKTNDESTEQIFPDNDEEESEMESDDDGHIIPTNIPTIKRKLPQSTKRMKIPKFVNPTKQQTMSSGQKIIRPEDMFESVQREEMKNFKMELKTIGKFGDNEEIVINKHIITQPEGGFGLMFPANKALNENKDEQIIPVKAKEFISTEELAANKISTNDLRLLPVFKNYHAGKPSNRLYIKNLSKQVEVNDLHYIYRRYIKPSSGTGELEYEVRLMQEGRMKGQAFVTFQNMEQAKLALDDTNGFILKDKPMVVQYAKAAKS